MQVSEAASTAPQPSRGPCSGLSATALPLRWGTRHRDDRELGLGRAKDPLSSAAAGSPLPDAVTCRSQSGTPVAPS